MTNLDSTTPYVEYGYCNGTNATVMTAHACLVPMDIWVDVFHYDFRDPVQARVAANNFYGWSDHGVGNDNQVWIR